MKISIILSTIVALGLANFVIAADDDARTKIAIQVSDDGGGEDLRIEFDSDDTGFDLHDMQVGENRSIVDKSGKTIMVTRQENGFWFDVDGKTIEMPAFDGGHHQQIWVDGDMDDDVEVHIVGDADFVGMESMDGIMIVSGKPIDDTTQQAIRSLLNSAGHGNDVKFIDHDEHQGGGMHQVKVVRKTVENTQ